MSARYCVIALALLCCSSAPVTAQDAGDSPRTATVATKKPVRPPIVVTDEARRIHNSAILIDGHNDLPWEIRSGAESSFDNRDIAQPQPKMHTDIARLRSGGVGAQFWSAYVPAETMRTGGAVRETLEQIELIHRMIARYPETFELAGTADDIVRIHRAGKIASMIGIEGGHSIENSLGVLRIYYTLGARYMTLTHSNSLDWADSATDEAKNNGLSSFGAEVVREMNRLGMLVDISHVSPETMRAAIRISRAPVIASHSGAFVVAPHPRNIPDDVLDLMHTNGGVAMINFFSGYVLAEAAEVTKGMFAEWRKIEAQYPAGDERKAALKKYREANPMPRGTVHDVVDHIDHIVKVAGIDHVGLGSDFDGVTSLPEQLEDVSCYPYITQELLNRGYDEAAIRKILGENLLRVMRAAEEVAHHWNDAKN